MPLIKLYRCTTKATIRNPTRLTTDAHTGTELKALLERLETRYVGAVNPLICFGSDAKID